MSEMMTTLSARGQVRLPKAIREQRQWPAGTRLVVEPFGDGVLLRPEVTFPPTRIEDVFGCLTYDGPPKSLEEMDEAVLAEAQRRHAGR